MGRDFFVSPIGILEIVSDGRALTRIDRIERSLSAKNAAIIGPDKEAIPDEITAEAKRQLKGYFDGKLNKFDLPIKFEREGFCRRVWESIAKIPYGKTITYGELAAMSGSPKAYRSAGSCTGKNPILIVVPCHRVVASGGIGGFGLGLEAKRYLLTLEKNNLNGFM